MACWKLSLSTSAVTFNLLCDIRDGVVSISSSYLDIAEWHLYTSRPVYALTIKLTDRYTSASDHQLKKLIQDTHTAPITLSDQ